MRPALAFAPLAFAPLAFVLLAEPAAAQDPAAGVAAAVPLVVAGIDGFAEAAAGLAAAAEADCRAEALRGPFRAAWAAWAPVADVRLGPSEQGALSIAFWPDERGSGQRALDALVAGGEVPDLAAFADVSVAARGFPALDYLLFDAEASAYADGSAACALVRVAAADLAAQAAALEAGWADHAGLLTGAGGAGNAAYLSADEAWRALYTQAVGGLEFTADTRLGRPLGEFDRPRPTRAEFWRSGTPLAGALASAEGAVALARALNEAPLPASEAALAEVLRAAGAVRDPSFQDIADPTARLRLEILQERVRALKDAVEAEVGAPRGIAPGFNSQDGD